MKNGVNCVKMKIILPYYGRNCAHAFKIQFSQWYGYYNIKSVQIKWKLNKFCDNFFFQPRKIIDFDGNRNSNLIRNFRWEFYIFFDT